MSPAIECTKLNLGCGANKITGAWNVDSSDHVKPDQVFSLDKAFPLESESFDEVYLFHTIEHLEKWKHLFVFTEIHRVMRHGGILYISYPEFEEVVKHWLARTNNDRKFWEATIYGRQSYPGDYHVAAMDTLELRELLADVGYRVLETYPEPSQPFNTVVKAERVDRTISYEELLYKEVFGSNGNTISS